VHPPHLINAGILIEAPTVEGNFFPILQDVLGALRVEHHSPTRSGNPFHDRFAVEHLARIERRTSCPFAATDVGRHLPIEHLPEKRPVVGQGVRQPHGGCPRAVVERDAATPSG